MKFLKCRECKSQVQRFKMIASNLKYYCPVCKNNKEEKEIEIFYKSSKIINGEE